MTTKRKSGFHKKLYVLIRDELEDNNVEVSEVARSLSFELATLINAYFDALEDFKE